MLLGLAGIVIIGPRATEIMSTHAVPTETLVAGSVWLLCVAAAIVRGRQYREVWLCHREVVVVSTRGELVHIPLQAVRWVDAGHPLQRPRRVTLRLFRDVDGLRKVVFIPRDGSPFGASPRIAQVLRRAIRSAGASTTGDAWLLLTPQASTTRSPQSMTGTTHATPS
jgi:hypothetical protein